MDKLAETQYGREKPRGQGLTYSHWPSWETEHMGTVLRGNWRQRLKIEGEAGSVLEAEAAKQKGQIGEGGSAAEGAAVR